MPIKYLTNAERKQEIKFGANNGIKFVSRRDLSGTIYILLPNDWNDTDRQLERIAEATADFMRYFSFEIYPFLNGFAGYDTLRFKALVQGTDGNQGSDKD